MSFVETPADPIPKGATVDFLTAFDGTEPASIVPGFSYTITNSIGDVSAVLNALAKESLLNIIWLIE